MAIWDPITQTGHTQGDARNWTTTVAAQNGTIRTATPSNVNTVIASCSPGDVVRLSNGTYGAITVGVSGTSANKIVIVAQNPGTYGARNVTVTAGKVTVSGSNIIIGGFKFTWGTAPGNLFLISSSGIEVTDIDFHDVTSVSGGKPRMIVIGYNGTNAYFHHNWLKNVSNLMGLVQDADYPNFATGVRIKYNTFESVAGGASAGYYYQLGNQAYVILDNSDLCETASEFSYNKVVTCYVGEIKTANNVVHHNYFLNNEARGIGFRSGNGNQAYSNYFKNCLIGISVFAKNHVIVNNVFDGNTQAAVSFSEGSLYSQIGTIYNAHHERAENILCANNVLIGNNGRGFYLGKTQTGRNINPEPYSPINIWLYNNIITQSAGVAVYFQNPDTVPVSSDGYPTNVSGYHRYVDCEVKNNDIYVTGTAVIGDNSADGGSPPGYINWNHASLTSGSVVSGNKETNPLLTSTYRVQPTSPAINAGTTYSKNGYSSATMEDWDGDARTIGAAPDIGVDEFGLNVHTPTVGTWYLFGGQVVALGNPYSNFEMVPGQCALLFNGNFPLKGKSKTTETGTLYFNGGHQGRNKEAGGGVLYFNGGTLSGNFVWSAVASTVTTWRVL